MRYYRNPMFCPLHTVTTDKATVLDGYDDNKGLCRDLVRWPVHCVCWYQVVKLLFSSFSPRRERNSNLKTSWYHLQKYIRTLHWDITLSLRPLYKSSVLLGVHLVKLFSRYWRGGGGRWHLLPTQRLFQVGKQVLLMIVITFVFKI